jgi:cell division protein FtsZ
MTVQQEEQANVIVRHNLIQEEPQAEPEAEADENQLVYRVADNVNFIPAVEEPVAAFVPQPELEPAPVVGLDDNKSNESIEDQLRKSRERIMRLKDLSMKLRNGNIQELENVPAYKRKEISLQQTPASDESSISKFSLSDNDGNPEIRRNNSFLHDNVD